MKEDKPEITVKPYHTQNGKNYIEFWPFWVQ